MRFFIQAKHWQLFIVFILAMLAPMLSILKNPILYAVSIAIYMAVYFGWLCSVACECNRRTRLDMQKSPVFMFAGLAYALVYTTILGILLAPAVGNGEPPNMWLIFPFHLFAMIGIFYSLAFTANRLVTFQRNENVGFVEYRGQFFMFWFFPLGVWFVQPKVNNLLSEKSA